MASLGTLSISITADLSKFKAQLKDAGMPVKEFTKVLTNEAKKATKGVTTSLTEQYKYWVNLKGVQTQVVDTYIRKNGQMIRSTQTLSKSAGRSFGMMIKEMLNLRSFMMKIIHYITFSIGVQMVMQIRQGIQFAIDSFVEFEKSVVNAAAVAGYMGRSFDEATEAVARLSRELARRTIFTATETAEAMYTVASAGIDPVTTSANELIPILQYATATQTDLKEATQSVIVVLKQFKLGLEKTGLVVDTFTSLITNSFMTAEKMANAFQYVGQIAGELNQDVREIASALTLLTDRGYTGSQAGQRLNMIFTKLIKPTEKAEKMLASIGLTLSEIDPTTNSLVDILHKLRNANFGVAESAHMFRARTAAAAATLVNAVEEVEEYVMISKEMGGITEFIAEKQMDTLSGKFRQLTGDAQELAITIGDKVAGSFYTLIDAIRGVNELSVDGGGVDIFGILIDWGKSIPLFGWIGTFITDTLENVANTSEWANKKIASAEAWQKLTKSTKYSMSMMDKYSHETLPNYLNAYKRIVDIKAELAKYSTDEMKDTQDYKNLLLELTKANQTFTNSEDTLIRSSTEMFNTLLEIEGAVSTGLTAYKNKYEAQSKITQLEKREIAILEELSDIEEKLKKTGIDREEEATLMNRYNTQNKLLITTREELGTASENLKNADEKYHDILKDATETEMMAIKLGVDLLDNRGKLLRATQDYNSALIEFNRLSDIVANKQKYIAEAMLPVYELQDKLYEIELKRYKLTEDKKKLDEELFDNLAEQGLLTEEIIEEYKEWQQAEGDLAKARVAYARGDITGEQLQEYIDAAATEQGEFSNLAQRTAQHYVDIGIASNAVATTLTNIYTQSNDLEQSAAEYEYTSEQLALAWEDVNELVGINRDTVDEAAQKLDLYLGKLDQIISKLIKINQLQGDAPRFSSTTKTPFERVVDTIRDPQGTWDEFGDFVRGVIRDGIPHGQKGFITKGPQLSMIGEKGAEAVVPLEGANRRFGKNIMQHVLSSYYPDLMKLQHGGIIGAGAGGRGGSYTSNTEEYNIMGPITVTGVSNVGDFMNQLKASARASKRY